MEGEMDDEERKKQIAQFRFGLISEFVTGVCLYRGDIQKLINEKCSRKYSIPYSNRTMISRATLKKWIRTYKESGRQFESLFPRSRRDRGGFRSIDQNLQLEIKNIVQLNPDWNGNLIVKELRFKKILDINEDLNRSVLYRLLKQLRTKIKKHNSVGRQSFEALAPNDLWQSDILHGPNVFEQGKWKKSYLIAILDDHSRFILHAEFYLSEKTETFKLALKDAISRRGIPLQLYIDNGSCYRAINIEQITAQLGIRVIHTPPYTPQGRGKIERWFRNVRENFLASIKNDLNIEKLNQLLFDWVGNYQDKVHTSTNATPWERYRNLKNPRPAPKNLLDYFRVVEFRLVRKDRTFLLNGTMFEAPSGLIDLRVELRFHKENPDEVEVFYEGLTHGFAPLLNKNVNYKNRRPEQKIIDQNKQIIKINIENKSGELFSGDAI
jgi:putative transposase